MGMTAVIGTALAGGGLVSGLPFWQAVLAMVLGVGVLVFLLYMPLGKIGAAEGLNTYLVGEGAFGSIGSNLATAFVVTIIPCVGWYGIQVALASQAVTGVFHLAPLGANIVTVLLGIIFAIPPMFGIISMAWLDYVAIPIMALIAVYGVWVAVVKVGGLAGIAAYQPPQHLGLGWGINLQIGYMAVAACFVCDYTRWMRNRWSDVVLSGTLGIYPWSIILVTSGMIMALTAGQLGVTQTWNIVEVMIALGLSSLALILILLLQLTTCIVAVYSSGLALHKVFGWSRFWWCLIAAALGIALALSGIVNYFLGFLGILAAFVTPAGAVIIADYFIVSKGRLARKGSVHWPGLLAWLCGGLLGYFVHWGVPALNGMILAFVLYVVLEQFHKHELAKA
jgi:cytosine permease